jgi:hypothetical protein
MFIAFPNSICLKKYSIHSEIVVIRTRILVNDNAFRMKESNIPAHLFYQDIFFQIGRMVAILNGTHNDIMYTRLVGAAWCNHPSHTGCPRRLCGHLQGRRGRHLNMPRNWVLPAPGAHQGVGRIQKRLHEGQWRVEFHWHPAAIYLPCLGRGAALSVDTAASVSVYASSSMNCPSLVQQFLPQWCYIILRRSMYV